MKSIIRIFVFALITVIIGGVLIKLDYNNALKSSNSTETDKVAVQIKEGSTVDEILQSLVDKGLLKERWLNYAKFYLKQKDLYSKLQAGSYSIPKNLNILEIIDTLQNGKNPDVWVTIPEGVRKDQIVDIVYKELPNLSKEKLLALTTDTTFISTLGLIADVKDLEGYLFPDKYAFSAELKEEDVLKRLVDTFKTKIGATDIYKDIIMASIVEREGYNAEDRPIIAGIIKKRIAEGWLIQTDATLLYPKKDWKHEITQQDKDENSPYNTYKFTGLPPTPICNPGLQSVQAVRQSVSSPYYYYIHDKEGKVHFATTLAEHNANINTYLK